jgi:hypothetical protein
MDAHAYQWSTTPARAACRGVDRHQHDYLGRTEWQFTLHQIERHLLIFPRDNDVSLSKAVKGTSQWLVVSGQFKCRIGLVVAMVVWQGLFAPWLGRGAEEIQTLITDRTAVERVYYAHRLGAKPAFEQALPPSLIDRLVKQELRKEAVLKRAYGVEITPELVAVEVQRINSTTHAPEVLTELKAALGNDPARFACTMARPILVERILRQRFENDHWLHAPQRHEAEAARETLLAARRAGEPREKMCALLKASRAGIVEESDWLLTPRPVEAAPATPNLRPGTASQIKAGSSLYTMEGTAQLSQVLSSGEKEAPGREREWYFEDLDPDLQRVLNAELVKVGDVTAVIEAPRGFLLFVAGEKTPAALKVVSLSIPKRSFEEWLAAQPGNETTRDDAGPVGPQRSVTSK